MTSFKEVDYTPLIAKLKELFGNHDFKIDLTDNKRPQIISPNLWADSGIFQYVIHEVKVYIFYFAEQFDYGVYTMSITVDLGYASYGDGSNGMSFMTAWYNEVMGWTFKIQKEKYAC